MNDLRATEAYDLVRGLLVRIYQETEPVASRVPAVAELRSSAIHASLPLAHSGRVSKREVQQALEALERLAALLEIEGPQLTGERSSQLFALCHEARESLAGWRFDDSAPA